jgi:pSer/pThr/pTyr-binding forkhead associated (FHA) protein
VEDQNSRNGTFLNGHRVIGQEELVPGASLRLSNEEFEITFL